MKKSKYLLLLLFPICLIVWIVSYALASGPIIADKNLEAAIRIAINYEKGEIRADQLAGIQELILRDSEIESLDGIEHLTSLVSLDLRDNNIQDISQLSSLTNLHELNLRGNKISNIDALAELTSLRQLNIRDNNIQDIDALKNLVQLRDLNARNNLITNIEPLTNLENLRDRLYLEGNPITDFSPVLPYFDEILQTDVDPNNYSDASLLQPIFSHAGGFYESSFHLEITSPMEEAVIYYTLDGSEPDPISNVESTYTYEGPITIEERTDNPLSAIPTNFIVEARDWKEPQPSKSGMVIRAYFETEEMTSGIITRSYFIQPQYTLPVISLVTDADHLFDEETGIYVPGVHYESSSENRDATGNYYQRGDEWERPIHIEYYESNGDLAFAQDAGVRIHGNFTRRFPQKSLRLYSRSDYGTSRFSYQFFDEKPINDFNRILLRNSGNDWGMTMFRDAALQSLVHHLNLDTQYYKPTIVFINGEYWGIHNVRDRLDQHYLETHYGGDRGDFTILEREGRLSEGSEKGQEDYALMIEYVKNNNLAEQHHFEHIQSLMDIDNYRNYYITQIYNANTDWPQNNISYWRYEKSDGANSLPGLDGRWRWMAFDMDRTLGYVPPSHNTVEWATSLTNERHNHEWPNVLFRSLLNNEQFKHTFINEFADHLNTTFHPDRVIQTIQKMKAGIEPEMENHIKRWGAPTSMDEWNNNVEKMIDFAEQRPMFVREHLANHFNLGETVSVQIKSDSAKGTVQINSIKLDEETPGVMNPDLWTGQYFQGVPVTITATPKQGYTFVGWKGAADGNSETLEMELSGDVVLEAVFE